MADLQLTGTPAEDIERLLDAEEACEAEGAHKPHELWDWRCEHCECLLCKDCENEVDSCSCREGASHGRAS